MSVFTISDDEDDTFDPVDDSIVSDSLRRSLTSVYRGNTIPLVHLSHMISDTRIEDDMYSFRCSPQIMDYFGDRFLIGELTLSKNIMNVVMIFYDYHDNIVLDDDGNPIQYTSTSHDLGHLIDILHSEFTFSYVKYILNLQSDSNLDFRNLFFHFSYPRSSEVNRKGIIVGPKSFSIDSKKQIYKVSIKCPLDFICMWLLDNEVIAATSSSSVILIFQSKHIGKRKLSYVKIIGNNRITLASLLLSILPNTKRGKTLLHNDIIII